MAELMFGLGQTKKKKDTEAKIKQTKDQLKDVKITDTVETSARKEQFDRDKGYAATARQTKKDLKDVKITDTVESDVRKEQHTREQKWKQDGRENLKKNNKYVKLCTLLLASRVRKRFSNSLVYVACYFS